MDAGKETLDFIVIGAQKSGTSSLFRHLSKHPEIFVPTVKEAGYFCHDGMLENLGWSDYMGVLAAATGGKAQADPSLRWGTVTPRYMLGVPTGDAAELRGYDERTIPRRIHERLPAVRLIAILRDPVARALSNHRMLVRRGRDRRTFDEAAAELLAIDALARSRRHAIEGSDYFVRGEYGRILAGYLDVFPREQLLVVFTDELERDPAELLAKVQRFIGVSADFAPENVGKRYNVGRAERSFQWGSPSTWLSPSSPMGPHGLRRALADNRTAQAVWATIPLRRQRTLLAPYERLTSSIARWNRRKPANEVRANAAPSADTLARARAHFRADGELLESLIGERPPWLADDS
jgi:hypothetical protein